MAYRRQIDRPDLVVFESTLYRTTSTLIIGAEHTLLVDPNWLPLEVEELAGTLTGRGGHRRSYLLFTHSDYDHIIGYGRFPGATTIASRRFVDNPLAEDQLRQAREWDEEYYVERSYSLRYPRIDLPQEGQTEISLGGEMYRFFPAQGHNYDGLLTLHRDRGILVAGDYLSNVEFPYLYHSVADYRRTLDSLTELIDDGQVQLLVPGHGDVTEDHGEMRRRLDDSYDYLDRLETAARTGVDFDPVALSDRYSFPSIMRKFHVANLKLARKELTSAKE